MGTSSETTLQRRLVELLQEHGSFAMRQRLVGRRGWPDLYAILPCRCACHLEVKRPGETADRLQRLILNQLQRAGAVTGLVDSAAATRNLIHHHLSVCPRLPGLGRALFDPLPLETHDDDPKP